MALFISGLVGAQNKIEYGVFPGGEVYLKTDVSDCKEVTAELKSSNDVMALLLLTDALKREEGVSHITLKIPYFPYARQDRTGEGAVNQSLSVKVMADLINSLGYGKVVIIEPHSDVTPALLDKVSVLGFEEVGELIVQAEGLVLICPDRGATKRTQAFAKKHGIRDIIYCDKVRDMSTGKITSTMVNGLELLEGKQGLIVDDICDGGFTFIQIAKEIRKTNKNSPLHLAVAHGIFSKGKEELGRWFTTVEAYNDFTNESF